MQGPQDLYLCHILSSVINGNADPPSPRGCCPKRIDDAGFSRGVRQRPGPPVTGEGVPPEANGRRGPGSQRRHSGGDGPPKCPTSPSGAAWAPPPLHGAPWGGGGRRAEVCRCTPGACPARHLCTKSPGSSPKSILSSGSPPSRPALDRKPSLKGTTQKSKYETSTTHNVTPITYNHRPCHRHKLGAKDGPDSWTWREGSPDCLVRGGAKTGTGGEWSTNDAGRAPSALILPLRTLMVTK